MRILLVVFLALAVPAFREAMAQSVANGDSAHGKEIYAQECTGCHALNETLVGPKHCGVFGRRVGSVPGYAYSDVMKQGAFVWDTKHLDGFLKSPITYLNGTNMGYAGLDSPKDRADVIAYLKQAMDPAVCASAPTSQAAESQQK